MKPQRTSSSLLAYGSGNHLADRFRRGLWGAGLAVALGMTGSSVAAERPVHCGLTPNSTDMYRVTVHRIGRVRCPEALSVAARFTGGAGRRRERPDGTFVVSMGRGWRCYTPGVDFTPEHCRRAAPRATIIIRTVIADGLAPGGGVPIPLDDAASAPVYAAANPGGSAIWSDRVG